MNIEGVTNSLINLQEPSKAEIDALVRRINALHRWFEKLEHITPEVKELAPKLLEAIEQTKEGQEDAAALPSSLYQPLEKLERIVHERLGEKVEPSEPGSGA